MGGVTMGIVLCSLLLVLFLGFGEGLECYGCASTVQHGECDRLYSVEEDDRREEYSRNCTQPFCVLETFTQHKTAISEGELYSVVRDCGDNVTYSFNLTYPLNLDLPPGPQNVTDNATVCGFDGKFTVCVLLCNTSFCNGPILSEVSTAWSPVCNMDVIIAGVALYFLYGIM